MWNFPLVSPCQEKAKGGSTGSEEAAQDEPGVGAKNGPCQNIQENRSRNSKGLQQSMSMVLMIKQKSLDEPV